MPELGDRSSPAGDLRITHYSYVLPDCYCTELGVNVTGGVLSWAVDQLRLAGFEELEAGARRVRAELAQGRRDPRLAAPLFLPYLGDGERDDPALRAAFVGLSDRTRRDELAYAVLEGLAFAIAETVSVLRRGGLAARTSCGWAAAARGWPPSARSRPTRWARRWCTSHTTRRRSAWRCWRPPRSRLRR